MSDSNAAALCARAASSPVAHGVTTVREVGATLHVIHIHTAERLDARREAAELAGLERR